jgi:hypothetical protein
MWTVPRSFRGRHEDSDSAKSFSTLLYFWNLFFGLETLCLPLCRESLRFFVTGKQLFLFPRVSPTKKKSESSCFFILLLSQDRLCETLRVCLKIKLPQLGSTCRGVISAMLGPKRLFWPERVIRDAYCKTDTRLLEKSQDCPLKGLGLSRTARNVPGATLSQL